MGVGPTKPFTLLPRGRSLGHIVLGRPGPPERGSYLQEGKESRPGSRDYRGCRPPLDPQREHHRLVVSAVSARRTFVGEDGPLPTRVGGRSSTTPFF